MNRILSMLSFGCSRHCDKEDGDPMFTMGQFTVPEPVLEIARMQMDVNTVTPKLWVFGGFDPVPFGVIWGFGWRLFDRDGWWGKTATIGNIVGLVPDMGGFLSNQNGDVVRICGIYCVYGFIRNNKYDYIILYIYHIDCFLENVIYTVPTNHAMIHMWFNQQ